MAVDIYSVTDFVWFCTVISGSRNISRVLSRGR